MPPMRLTLIGRRYCSLCDKLRVALVDAACRHNIEFELTELDLDDHPVHEGVFGEWIPVLLDGELAASTERQRHNEICHYHFDESKWLETVHVSRG